MYRKDQWPRQKKSPWLDWRLYFNTFIGTQEIAFQAIPMCSEHWKDRDTGNPTPWQRMTIPTVLRKTWGVSEFNQFYVPMSWQSYVLQQPLVVVEGIPDTLTWREGGVQSVGTYNRDTPKNSIFQRDYRAFLDMIQPSSILYCIDAEKMNEKCPENDVRRVWWWEFLRLSRGIPCRFVDFSQSEFGDSNDVWKAVGFYRESFLSRIESLTVKKPDMPRLKPKKKIVKRKQNQNVSHHDFDVEQIKADTDFLQVVLRYTSLRQWATTNGGEYAGTCPFCGASEKHFHVFPELKRWFCRKCHPKWDDAIAFVWPQIESDFRKALELLR